MGSPQAQSPTFLSSPTTLQLLGRKASPVDSLDQASALWCLPSLPGLNSAAQKSTVTDQTASSQPARTGLDTQKFSTPAFFLEMGWGEFPCISSLQHRPGSKTPLYTDNSSCSSQALPCGSLFSTAPILYSQSISKLTSPLPPSPSPHPASITSQTITLNFTEFEGTPNL